MGCFGLSTAVDSDLPRALAGSFCQLQIVFCKYMTFGIMGTIERVYKCKGTDPERCVGAAAALPAAVCWILSAVSAVCFLLLSPAVCCCLLPIQL